MLVTAYQQKGRDHIRYINRRAHNIWEKYGYKNEKWFHCLKEALQEHIKYLEDVDRLNREVERRETERQKAAAVKKNAPVCYWRNRKTNEWEPLIV
jgi:hypothetical protein